MHKLELEDIERVAELPYPWEKLNNKVIFVSGGNGFIGSFLCNVLRYRNHHYKQNIKVVCLSLNNSLNDDTVTFIQGDVRLPITYSSKTDYVIHLASNTHPQQYSNDPVGTITTNVFGTYNLLNLAKQTFAKRFILASSVEIYGDGSDSPMDEMYCGYINSNTARAGYNESKRVCESMCQSFFQQYGVECCIFRMARVFGADNTKKDTKALAQFFRNAVDGQDIVLKSAGHQKYSYVYIADAVSGILKVMLDGIAGEAYNISSDYNGFSLKDFAEYISSLVGRTVLYNFENNPSVSQSNNALLCIDKIKEIGFRPLYSVEEGLKRTLRILIDSKNDHDNKN